MFLYVFHKILTVVKQGNVYRFCSTTSTTPLVLLCWDSAHKLVFVVCKYPSLGCSISNYVPLFNSQKQVRMTVNEAAFHLAASKINIRYKPVLPVIAGWSWSIQNKAVMSCFVNHHLSKHFSTAVSVWAAPLQQLAAKRSAAGEPVYWDNWVQLKNPYAILTDASTVRETSNFKLTQPASRSDWAAAATQQSQMRSRRVIKDFCLRQRRLYSKIITYFLFWQKTFQLLR